MQAPSVRSRLGAVPCDWAFPGRVEYHAALQQQRALLEARARGAVPDTLWLLEHPPTITLGRRAERIDVLVDGARLAALGIGVHETNRGGLVTYHGPGQLVGYPICALRELTGGDVVRFVSGLEETLIRVLDRYGIRGEREAGHRGVWVGGAKIGAVGVAISRGVTMHGFALNLQPDLAHFGLIRPCGLADRGVTSVAALLGRPVDLTACANATASAFGAVFGRDMLARATLLAAGEAAGCAAGGAILLQV